jgi:cytochrome c oxidase cbb3-type subunit 3
LLFPEERMGMFGRIQDVAPALAGVLIAGLFSLAGCDREQRDVRPTVAAETGPKGVSVSDLYPGPYAAPTPDDPRAQEYEGNAFHISNGQREFAQFNCVGCHFNGGGGIGPALMDNKWRYGNKIEQIYASIAQGRPNGMPAFRDKIPEQEIWELAAYVRTLSGQANKLAAPSRQDAIRSIPPINNADKQPQTGDASATQAGPG